MNVLSLTGNLGNDCRINQVSGTTVCNFSVAMKAGFGDKAQTIWVDCALWGKQAESRLPEFLKKGQQVAVTGELSTREHEGKTYLQVRCNSVDLVGGKQEGGSGGNAQPVAQNNQPAQQQPSGGGGSMDDDIPFAALHNIYGG